MHLAPRLVTCALLSLAAGATGCGTDGGGGSGGPDAATADGGPPAADAAPIACDLSPDARGLVEELIVDALTDASSIARTSSPPGSLFLASRLVGGGVAYNNLLGVGACTTRTPVCFDEPDFEGDALQTCQRGGCDEADVPWGAVYWTVAPEDDDQARHAFAYPTTAPVGQAVADPNPRTEWRFDFATADEVGVAAELDVALAVTPTGGSAIVLDHTGTLTARAVDGALDRIDLAATFPALVAGGVAALSVSVEEGAQTGELRVGDLTLATFAGAFPGAPTAIWCP